MTLMRVAAHDGMVLTYDTDDAEDVHIEAPNDVHEVGHTESGAVLRELGQAHLVLRVDFKPGKRPLWVDQATAALPDLRMGGEHLRAALDAEGIPADVASRIWNRFFYGQPWGLDMPPMTPEQADEWREQEQVAFPAGQTASERMAAMLDASGFTDPRAVALDGLKVVTDYATGETRGVADAPGWGRDDG